MSTGKYRGLGWIDFEARKCWTNLEVNNNEVSGLVGFAINGNGKTTILIAHRISTIQNADIIMVLEDGTAAEIGNHDSLMAKHGIYYDMFEKQQLEAIHGEAGKALIRQNYPAAKTGKEDA